MSTFKPMLLLITVIGWSSNAATAKTGKPTGLEVFPAEYHESGGSSPILYLTDSPLALSIETYKLLPRQRAAILRLQQESAETLSKLSEKFVEKRLAVVADGRVISSPVIKTKIGGQELAISFDSDQGFADFEAILQASSNT